MKGSSASRPQEDRTFVELLRRRAFEHPTRLACTYLGDGEVERSSLTYGELDRRARAIGARLAALGATGERVLLLYPAGLEFIAAFLGCLYAGAVAVPAYPPRVRRHMSRLQTILADSQASVALTATSVLARVEPFIRDHEQIRALRWIATDTLADDLAEDWREPEIDPSTLAFLQYTSGSTAAPKGVMVSHSNLLHNERLIQSAFRQTDESIIVGWLPLYHDMGLIGNVLQPLYLGASSILMAPTTFLQSPVRWLQAISDYRATTSGAPNFAYDLCVRRVTPAQRETLDLSSWSVAYNGAEPVRRETMERFAAAFAQCGFRREAFFPCYGLAEATLFVAGKLRDGDFVAADFRADGLENDHAIAAASGDEARALISCGGSHTDQQVIIVDPVSHTERPESVIGEIWVAGPSVAKGYWNQPAATAETFHARLAEGDEGPFLRTGDLGVLHHGELFITGRLKDLIIIRGRNHYPQDIEWSVERSHASVVVGGGAAFSIEVEGEERLVIAQEVEAGKPERQTEIIHAIQQSIAEDHEIQVYAIALLKPRTIPKTSSGKIQRHACRVGFLSGELKVLAEWRAPSRSGSETTTHIQADGAGTLEVEQVTVWLVQELTVGALGIASHIDAGQSCAAAGLDSLGAVELAHRIEMKFGVVMTPASFLTDTSITELAYTILARSTAGISADGEPPATVEHSGPYPLSRGQQALWFLHQLHPQSTAYNISSALRITTELDGAALRNAFNLLVERHAALRITFSGDQDGEPAQHTHERAEIYFIEHDARIWTEVEVTQRLIEEANKPFDLAQGPTCRLSLFVRDQRERILLLSIHHIIADFWSLGILLHEMGEIYAAERQRRAPQLPPLNLQYADYVRWQARMLASADGARLWRYWQQQLAGASLSLDLPFDSPRQALQSHHGASLPVRLDPELAIRIKELGHARQATLFMTLLAAFYALLYRYTGQPDLLVGSPVAGRSRADFSGIVGYFVNPLVLRAQISERMSFSELLAQVRQTTLAGLEHQEYPFPMLVERLQPERDPSYSPLFQVMFVLQKARHPNEERLAAFALGEAYARIKLDELELESIALKQRVAQFDLTLAMTEMDYGLGMSWQYCADLFEPATIERMAGHFRRLLEGVAADPTALIHTLPMLTPPEERQILLEWNATARAYPRQQCIHQLFEAQVERAPDQIAVICDTAKLTYRQLNARAHRLALRLQHLGVKPEVRVAILAERSIELVVGLLGILKAGGAYVPLDPAYPEERLRVMVKDSGARVMLVGAGMKELAPDYSGEVVELGGESSEGDGSEEKEYGDGCGVVEVGEENVAYVIYTSGSTGRPKGVAITHRSACAFLHWAREFFTAEELSGVLAATSICFDLSVFELFAPLSWGGAVLLAENALHVGEMAPADQVTLINTVPSAMTELARIGAVPASVRTINLAGEALKRSLTEKIYELPQIRRVLNLYGPSEDTTYSTYTEVRRGAARDPEIGRPIANTQVYILDRWGQLAPVGVAGELYIGGMGLARGYLNRPDLTAERFVPHPFSSEPGARLYRTGDLARYLADGNIEYLGRIDHQVKVRGFRIELGEIETVLETREGVSQAVVVAREEANGEKRLVGYVVIEQGHNVGPLDLRAYLRESLPEYMVPTAIVMLASLPLSPNGKVDRKALPAPKPERPESWATYVPAQTPTEEILTGIWAEVLGLERIGPNENFFDLGGHSLLATQVIARIRNVFQLQLPLNELFEYPTVAGLAERVKAQMTVGQRLSAPISEAVTGESFPLSFAQQRLWFLDQLEPGRATYNMPGGAWLRGTLEALTFERALNEALRRHSTLRTTFPSRNGEPAQTIAEHVHLQLPVIDLSDLTAEERQSQTDRLVTEEAQQPFNLALGPLARFKLLRLTPTEHMLLATMHHIVADGWSLGILIREVIAHYEAYIHDQPSPLPELPIQYADFVRLQREEFDDKALDAQLDYWRERLAGAPSLLELPWDHPRPPMQTHRGAVQTFEIPQWLTAESYSTSRREGSTLFMLLLAVFQTLLYRYSGQTDFAVGTPIAGRNRKETEGLIGLFVNTLVLRVDLSNNPTFKNLLRQARECALGAYANQDAPFEMLVEELQPERNMSHTPLFQVMMVMLNMPGETPRFSHLEIETFSSSSGTAKFDLTLEFTEKAGRLTGRLEYNVDLFEAATIQRLLDHYHHLLSSVVADTAQRLDEFALLTPDERQQFLGLGNRDFRGEPASSQRDGETGHLGFIDGRAKKRVLSTSKTKETELAPGYIAPRTAEEELLVGIWAEVLGVERIGVEDNFFDLGGHSLLATQVIARARETFQIEIPVRDIFEEPTIAGAARRLRVARRAKSFALPTEGLGHAQRTEKLPLSYAQERLWFLEQFTPALSIYHIPLAVHLFGPLDHSLLERAFSDLISRHEALRTCFHTSDGAPFLSISPPSSFTIPLTDLQHMPQDQRQPYAHALLPQHAQQPFDLVNGPLLRAQLFRLAPQQHLLLVVFHHLIADGWSLNIFVREIAALYAAFVRGETASLPPLPLQYADYAIWQRQALKGEALDRELDYWRKQLAGVTRELKLPTDRPRTAMRSWLSGHYPFVIGRELSNQLRQVAQREGATLFMALLAGLKALLYRYTGGEDVVVGTVVAGREVREVEGLLGCFVNTLALRTKVNGGQRFSELVRAVRESCVGGYNNQWAPFEKVVEAVVAERRTGQTPLFDVMVVMQNTPRDGIEVEGLRLEMEDVSNGEAKYELTVVLFEEGEEIRGEVEYRAELFSAESIARLMRHYEELLGSGVRRSEERIGRLRLLSENEEREILVEWSRTTRPYPAESNIVAQFAAQVAHHPHSTALISGPDTLSYLDLDRRSNQLAHFLLDHHLNPEAPIALLVSRSPMMIVSLLGVLKAGGAYLPLDLQSPPARQAAMLTRAGVRLALTDQPLAVAALSQTGLWSGTVIDLNGSAGEMSGQPRTPPPIQLHPEMLAYIIHTSGSTGEPKGVAVTHRNVLRFVSNNTYARLDERMRMLQLAPLAFDALTLEVWGPLLNGGCVAQSGMETPRAKELREEIARHGITTLLLTTALFNAVVDEDARALEGLEELLLGGEAASVKHVKRAQEALPEVVIRNAYGPTEATTITSCHVVGEVGEEEVSIPIGRGIGNTEVYVLDEMMELAPEGVVGELYIGGAGLGRGYYGRGDETGERFAPHPYSEEGGERLYRSGDQVRWRKGGVLEYVGRRDGQVKLRGY